MSNMEEQAKDFDETAKEHPFADLDGLWVEYDQTVSIDFEIDRNNTIQIIMVKIRKELPGTTIADIRSQCVNYKSIDGERRSSFDTKLYNSLLWKAAVVESTPKLKAIDLNRLPSTIYDQILNFLTNYYTKMTSEDKSKLFIKNLKHS